MLSANDKVLVALSGGPDSTALLHVLRTLTPDYGLKLAVAHVNHGLRPGIADREAEAVRTTAADLGLTVYVEKIDLRGVCGSIEERARDARNAFLEHLALTHGYQRIAQGHQADDNAEALLMNLLRGSGLRGLGGIPPVRGRIIRPLIECHRGQILAYLKARNLIFATDLTNTDTRFLRNRVRHRLIPMLKTEFNPKIVAVLNRTAALCREEEGWWHDHLQPLISSGGTNQQHGSLVIPAAFVANLARPVQRRVLRELLRGWRGDLKRIGADHIDRVIDSLVHCSGSAEVRLPHAIAARREGPIIRFIIAAPRPTFRMEERPAFAYIIDSPSQLPMALPIRELNCSLHLTLTVPPETIEIRSASRHTAWFDLDRLPFPLEIRPIRPGDRMQPFGMAGHSKIKNLFIEKKIPRTDRRRIPLLVGGNAVLWAIGVRRSATAPIESSSTKALRIEWSEDL
jgi:tRNA(Ile)-lysidine synthase